MSEQSHSEAFEELRRVLTDPHRAQTASMWEGVVQSELGPEDRAAAERMAPIVKRYLSREIDRETYERELSAAAVPDVTNPAPPA